MNKTIFIICLNFICFLAMGKSGPEHIRDFRHILKGLHGDAMSNVYSDITKGIDENFVKSIGNKFGYPVNHRYLGHWGFEGSIPFNHEPWKSELKKYPRKELIKMWQEFNTELVEKVMKHTGLPKHQAKGLTGLLYNSHLLGDWVPGNKFTAPVLPVDGICKDLEKNLHRLLGKRSSKAKEIIKQLRQCKDANSQIYAEKALNVLKEAGLDDKLLELYGKRLSKKKIYPSTQLKTTRKIAALLKKPNINRYDKLAVSNKKLHEIAAKKNSVATTGKRTIVQGLVTPGGKLLLSVKAGAEAGIITFAVDTGIATFNYLKGDIWPVEYREQLKYAAVRGLVVGSCVAVTVVLGAAPGGWIVLAVGIGSYIVADLAIKVWESHLDKQYLTMEDLKAFGFTPENILEPSPDENILKPSPDENFLNPDESII